METLFGKAEIHLDHVEFKRGCKSNIPRLFSFNKLMQKDKFLPQARASEVLGKKLFTKTNDKGINGNTNVSAPCDL